MRPREFIGRLWVLALTVFVDMIGFLIVLPLLPFYAEKLGADPTVVGALVAAFAFGRQHQHPQPADELARLHQIASSPPRVRKAPALSAISSTPYTAA